MEKISGTIKRIAKTGGIILSEHEFKEDGGARWFNLHSGIKTKELDKLKEGQVVEFEINENSLILNPSKIIQDVSPEKKNLAKRRLMKLFSVVKPDDLDVMVQDMNEFCKANNVLAVVFAPRLQSEGYKAILWYAEEE